MKPRQRHEAAKVKTPKLSQFRVAGYGKFNPKEELVRQLEAERQKAAALR